jgi:four helix bundle protein
MEQGTGNKEGRHGFKQLNAWIAADDLASLVFRAVQKFPPQNTWLANQMARSAISVPANIAEGYGRGSLGDYLRFLDIAKGSLAEVEYYIHFVEKEGLMKTGEVANLVLHREKTGKLLHGLWLSLKRKVPADWDHSMTVSNDASQQQGISV